MLQTSYTKSDLRINSSPQALEAYREGDGCYVGVFPGWGEFEDSVDANQLIDF